MNEIMNYYAWRQRREDTMREANRDHLARSLRAECTNRTFSLAWELRRMVGLLLIEDAVVLARCLEQVVRSNAKDSVPSALRRYEGLRRERTAWIVRRSRALGRIGQIENPLLCRLRDAVLKAIPMRTQLRQLDQVLRYEERLG